MKLYDYAADGLKRALPTARIGGPHVTGPNGARTQQILRDFIEHCLRGTNYATGKIGIAARLRRLPRQGRAARDDGRRTCAWASATSCGRSPTASRSSRRFPS